MTFADGIRARHVIDECKPMLECDTCNECGLDWPCDAVRAADEIDRLAAIADTPAKYRDDWLAMRRRAKRAEAAIARVRELCAKRTAESRTPHIAVNVSEVLRALDGDR